jgi:quinohemoprotein amine dehydrogenase
MNERKRALRRGGWLACFVWAAVAFPAQAQTGAPASTAGSAAAEGIPVQSDLVRAKCGGCHRSDDKMRMSRISYRRATPENWERTIKRMVTLNHASLEPADARNILKYLADHQGLAPEEARPIAFEAERRTIEYTYSADKDASDNCSSCHTIARVLAERRTTEEWELLIAMHRGYYPLVDTQPMNGGQGWRRTRPLQTELQPDGRPADNRHPMDKALEHLEKTLPLNTPAWAAWSAAMQPPKLAGRWALAGAFPGKGAVYGQVTVTADPSAPDSFNTETRYTFTRSGEVVSRSGKALVYTGYQWRGRGTAGDEVWREVMSVERDWKTMSGRWFTGAYDETGIDVTLTRVTGEPVVLGASVTALKTGSAPASIKIFGANLPGAVTPEDIGLGQGVKVARVVSARADEIAIEVEVAANAPIGARDLSVAGTVKPSALVVFDKIDAVKVLPQAGMARVGGNVFPEAVSAVRSGRLLQRPGRQAGHGRRSESRLRQREMVARGIHGDLRRRRPGVCRQRSIRTGCSRRTWTDRIRSGPAIATTSATCGSWHNWRSWPRRPQRPRGRSGRARICWSRCRSTWRGFRARDQSDVMGRPGASPV